MKIFLQEVDTCFGCPNHCFGKTSMEDTCKIKDYKVLKDEDIYVRDKDGFAVRGRYPDWCPLPDKM